MGIRDILKKSFLEGFSSAELSTTMVITTLVTTVLLGLYIYGIYRIVSRKTFYSKSFNISLVALAIITASIILTIQYSVVVSLGMVGALSIVRFRTAIKDPMDLVFLFWSLSVGIICGAGLFEVGIIESVIITIVLLALEMLPSRRESMLLIINAENINIEAAIKEIIGRNTKSYRVKSRNLTVNGMDMIVELRIKNGEQLIQEVNQVDGVRAVSLLTQEGEVTY